MGAPLLLRDKAGEHEGGGGGQGEQASDVAEVLKTANDTTLPMSQRFSVMMKALQGIDPTNQLATMKSKVTELEKTLSLNQNELAKAKADLETATKRIAALETDVSDAQAATADAEKKAKDLEAKEQDLAKRADAMAREKMKGLGFASNKLPSATDKLPQEANLEDARKAFAEAKDPLEKAKLNKRLKELEKKALASVN